MDLPLLEDDLAETGRHRGAHDAPPASTTSRRSAVLCFFNDVLERLAAEGRLREVYVLRSEIGHNPVYELATDDGPVTVVHPGVGAPLAAGFVEEVASLGVRTFVACGGAGALVDDLALGQVMVVTSALRDEGTSLHYVAPGRVIDADPLGVAVLEETLRAMDIPFFVGRTWTTDALLSRDPEPHRAPPRRGVLGRGHGVLRVHRRRALPGPALRPAALRR